MKTKLSTLLNILVIAIISISSISMPVSSVKQKNSAKPSRVKLKSVKVISKKVIRVKWKKVKKAKGYQIRISKNKKFTKARIINVNKNVCTKKVKKLNANTKYCVKVRAFVKVNGRKVFGKWSKTLSVRTEAKISVKTSAQLSDFDLFEDMLNKTCWVWMIKESLNTKTITVPELIQNFIIMESVPCGMYTYFWNLPDNYYMQTDPKGKFTGAYKLDANNVDWIIKNVFEMDPDRTLSSEVFYYYGDYLYRRIDLGGGRENIYEIKETKKLENGNYGFTVLTRPSNDLSKKSEERIYFVAKLKNANKIGHYWSISKFSHEASIIY